MYRLLPLLLLTMLLGCVNPSLLDTDHIPLAVRHFTRADLVQLRLPLSPDFSEALPLMGFDLATQHGHGGAGVGIVIIDFFGRRTTWGPDHGWAVMETLTTVAPNADYWTIDLDIIIDEIEDERTGVLDPVQRALQMSQTLQIRHGIDVINMSIGYVRSSERCSTGTKYDSSINITLQNLWERDVNIVTSAGNSGRFTPGYPACVPSVMAVGAVYDEDVESVEWRANERRDFPGCTDAPAHKGAVACFSHRGEIYAVGAFAEGYQKYQGKEPFSGTSLASPFVAGAIALLRAQGLNAAEARQRVLDTAVIGLNGNLQFKILDIAAALGLSPTQPPALPRPPPPPPPPPLMATVDQNDNGRIEDTELETALQAWSKGAPLQGRTLSDAEILEVISAWASGTAV